MKKLMYAPALTEALKEEMERSPVLLIIGEDVCRPEDEDGAFMVTAGLPKLFPDRVINTILNESSIVGLGAGFALRGGRVVTEMQFADFVTDAIKMIRNYSAGLFYRNRIRLPMVIRLPSGAPGRAGPFHSTSPEMLFFGEPGLIILAPSNSYDAKGLLKTAIRQDSPALFLEWKKLYRLPLEKYPPELDFEIPDEDYTVPIGKARVLREGSDITLVSYGPMLFETLKAANALKEKGVSCEVIDLRSLMPFDFETLSASVKKTGRIIVAHEDKEVGGYGAALIQLLTQKFGLFDWLDAQPLVVGAKFTPHPHNPILENEYLPNAGDVVNAAEKMFEEKIFASARIPEKEPVAKESVGKLEGFDPSSSQANTEKRIELTPMRKAIAKRMTEQWQRPHIHDKIKICFNAVFKHRAETRQEFEEKTDTRLTPTHYIAYSVVKTLMLDQFRPLRNRFEENVRPDKSVDWAHPKAIFERDFVNLSIAVATKSNELFVPVIRDAEKMSFTELASAIADSAEKCRNKKIAPDDFDNGTITITNVGVFGTDEGNPILTEASQMASIAVGEIKHGPGGHFGAIVMAFDHRMFDGKLAGEFKKALKEYLENWNVDIFSE